MPYQPFSKSDRLGKAADITGQAYNRGRASRYQSMFGAGDAYGYYHGEDESSFSLVNSTKKPMGMFQKRRWQVNPPSPPPIIDDPPPPGHPATWEARGLGNPERQSRFSAVSSCLCGPTIT